MDAVAGASGKYFEQKLDGGGLGHRAVEKRQNLYRAGFH